MDKKKILNKYSKPEDKLLISKMLDKIEMSASKNKIESTDFLDGYQCHLLEKILKQEKVENFIISGGIEDSERSIILFYPDKLSNVALTNYKKLLPIQCIKIKLSKEMYGKYTHRDYLGGLIKLGIKREKIGDILVFDDGADILMLDEISKFIENNIRGLTRFSKSEIENIKLEEVRLKEVKKQPIHLIVASMRLDCVIAEIAKTSRGKAEELISEGRVFVNFENIQKITKQIKEKDIITIRGKGRFEIDKIDGITKNNRVRMVVNKYV